MKREKALPLPCWENLQSQGKKKNAEPTVNTIESPSQFRPVQACFRFGYMGGIVAAISTQSSSKLVETTLISISSDSVDGELGQLVAGVTEHCKLRRQQGRAGAG